MKGSGRASCSSFVLNVSHVTLTSLFSGHPIHSVLGLPSHNTEPNIFLYAPSRTFSRFSKVYPLNHGEPGCPHSVLHYLQVLIYWLMCGIGICCLLCLLNEMVLPVWSASVLVESHGA